MSAETILRTHHLAKIYGRLAAVKDLNLEVYRGDVFGFLGPNGSGKTTTIGMVLGLVRPTAGSIELFGQALPGSPGSLLGRVGVVLEAPPFYPYLSGQDNLVVLARAANGVGLPRVKEVLSLVGLSARARSKVRTYSLGMKQRLAIAAALLHDPELLILDEPANGLDPAGMAEIRELVRRLGQQGKTVFLSSHLLHEVEQVCNRVAIIKQGTLLAQGTVDTMLRRGKVLELQVTDPPKALAILKETSWVTSAREEGGQLLVEAPRERAAEVSQVLAAGGVFISQMKAREDSLESFFLEVTEAPGAQK